MASDSFRSPNPYRPYVVPQHATPSLVSPQAAASPRDLLADLDIPTDYLQNPELGDLISDMVMKGISKYTATFIRQPFEIVKTTMQVQYLPSSSISKYPSAPRPRRLSDDEYNDESDTDDPPLFSASGLSPPGSPVPPRGRSRKRGQPPTSASESTSDVQSWEIPRDARTIGSIMGSIWTKEGAWGIWKGTNSTFIYTVLFDGIETWLGSLLAATFALPDPTLFDILDSPTPGTSLAAALTATAITALLLAPVDLYRITKMILPVPSARNQSVNKRTPTPVVIPNSLILPTVLHATIPNYLSSLFTLTLRPYFPRVSFSPTNYGLPFLASFLDLGIRLPLESVLRRAQIAYTRPERTIVRVGAYKGVIGTTWAMLADETGGIFRGWRIGFWGLMMVWVLKTTNVLGRGGDVEF